MPNAKDPRLIQFARENRQFDNPTARKMWASLRARRTLGVKWRREHIIGPFIADFYCPAAKIALELDGESHSTTQEYDASRDAFFVARGILVIRVSNLEAQERWDDLMDHVCRQIEIRLGELGRDRDYRVLP